MQASPSVAKSAESLGPALATVISDGATRVALRVDAVLAMCATACIAAALHSASPAGGEHIGMNPCFVLHVKVSLLASWVAGLQSHHALRLRAIKAQVVAEEERLILHMAANGRYVEGASAGGDDFACAHSAGAPFHRGCCAGSGVVQKALVAGAACKDRRSYCGVSLSCV